MANSLRELLIKLRLDSSEVTQGLNKVQTEVSALDKAMNFAGAAAGAAALGLAIAKVGGTLKDLAARGNTFNDLSGSFERLLGSTENATVALDRYREATRGLLTDTELFKKANLADQLGLTQTQFEALAASAETLGDAVGVDVNSALDGLVRGLGTGQARALKMLGVTVDLEKAQERFAKQLGISVKDLSEEAKLLAFRQEAFAKISGSMQTLAGEQVSVDDGFTQINNALDNFFDRVGGAIDNNKTLAETFKSIADAINEIDVQRFVDGIVMAGEAALLVVPGLKGTIEVIKQLNASLNPSVSSIDSQIAGVQGLIARTAGNQVLGPERISRQIQGYAARIADLTAQKMKLTGASSDVVQVQEVLNKAIKEGTDNAGKNRDSLIKVGDAANDAAKKLEEFKSKITSIELQRGSAQLADTFERIFNNIGTASQSNFLDRIATGSLEFNKALEDLKENVRQKTIEGFDAAFRSSPEAKAAAEAAATDAEAAYREKMGAAVSDVAIRMGEEMRAQLQASADFFSDAFYNIFTGQGFNLEDMGKRLAAGIVGGIAGNLFPEFGQFGNLQGLGQSIGAELIGSILGTGGGGGGGLLGSVLGTGGGGGLLGGLVGAGGGGLLGSLFGGGGAAASVIGPGGAIGGGGMGAASGMLAAVPGWGWAALAAGTAAFAFKDEIGKVFDDLFGSKNPWREARSSAFDTLRGGPLGESLNVMQLRGNYSLGNYQEGRTNQFTDFAIGLANPLAQIMGNGDEMMTATFASIFADATDNAKSMNEVLIQTQALMDGLGINATQAKDELTAAFLDGKVGLDELASGISSLNMLASDNLIGTGSVQDALRIVGDEATSNRAKLKGLELAFVEMSELGIDSTSEINAYLTEKFGPGVAAVFDRLAQSGIDSFEDIKNAGPDAIVAIFSALNDLETGFRESFENSTGEALKAVETSISGMEQALERGSQAFERFASAANRATNSLSVPTGNASVVDDNPKNYRYVS